MVEYPLISIITPCLNRVEFVAQSVESVLDQDYPHVEHIIMDGVSTDGTLDVLRQYPHLKITSEPDKGLYDAINKGIRKTHGDIIGLINTDDLYESNVFGDVIGTFKANPDVRAVLGGVTIFQEVLNGDRELLASYCPFPPSEFLFQVTQGIPLFNGWFFRRDVFEQNGYFNTSYRYAADREFLIRLALQNFPYANLDRIIYHYRQHIGSLTFNDEDNAESECYFEFRAIAEEYLSKKDILIQQRRYFLDWHNLITTYQVMHAMREFSTLRTLAYAVQGWRYDAWWPLFFIDKLIDRMILKLKK